MSSAVGPCHCVLGRQPSALAGLYGVWDPRDLLSKTPREVAYPRHRGFHPPTSWLLGGDVLHLCCVPLFNLFNCWFHRCCYRFLRNSRVCHHKLFADGEQGLSCHHLLQEHANWVWDSAFTGAWATHGQLCHRKTLPMGDDSHESFVLPAP